MKKEEIALRERPSSYVGLVRKPSLLVLWLGQFLSTAGDWLYTMALLWLTYQITESSTAMAAVSIASLLPVLLVGLFGGTLLDRWPKLPTLIALDLLRAPIVGVVPLLYVLGWLSPWTLALIGMLLTTFNTLFLPALQSSVPLLVRAEEIRSVMGSIDFSQRLGRILGPGLAGAILAVIPLIHFFTLDAFSFLGSALAFWYLHRSRKGRTMTEEKPHAAFHWRSLLQGGMYVIHHPILRTICLVRGLNNMAWAFYLLGAPVLVKQMFRGDLGAWGGVITAYSIGQLLGNAMAGNGPQRKKPLPLFFLGWIVTGIGFVGFGLAQSFPLSLLFISIAGVGSPFANITTDSYISLTVPATLLGRVFTLQNMLLQMMQVIGLACAGAALAFFPSGMVISCAGVSILAVSASIACASSVHHREA